MASNEVRVALRRSSSLTREYPTIRNAASASALTTPVVAIQPALKPIKMSSSRWGDTRLFITINGERTTSKVRNSRSAAEVVAGALGIEVVHMSVGISRKEHRLVTRGIAGVLCEKNVAIGNTPKKAGRRVVSRIDGRDQLLDLPSDLAANDCKVAFHAASSNGGHRRFLRTDGQV
jgi:hypothetical protein